VSHARTRLRSLIAPILMGDWQFCSQQAVTPGRLLAAILSGGSHWTRLAGPRTCPWTPNRIRQVELGMTRTFEIRSRSGAQRPAAW